MKKHIAFIILGLALLQPAQAEINVLTEQAPPNNMMEDGKVVGNATHIVRQIFADSGVKYTLKLTSWSIAYRSALEDKDTCVYATNQTEERKPLFEWVGPLLRNDWWLLARSDSPLKIEKLEDAKSLSIGGYKNDALALFLKSKGYKVDEASIDEVNINKLLEGHIDLWTASQTIYPYLLEKNDAKDKIKPVLSYHESYLYLACNKNTDPQELAKLRAVVKKL